MAIFPSQENFMLLLPRRHYLNHKFYVISTLFAPTLRDSHSVYAMKLGYLTFSFHTIVMLLFVWAPGSKQTLIRPFQKCTVHVCSLNDSKVMKGQSSRPPQKNAPQAFKQIKSSFCIVNRLSPGSPGSIPVVRKV